MQRLGCCECGSEDEDNSLSNLNKNASKKHLKTVQQKGNSARNV